ncbi:MAG TPA: cysteine--tRNA ligase [Bauldia sp.]|nr:cysteine--tRNA ligase [Bauldia sp.]
MGLRLYSTLSRTKEDFVPIDPANIRMYVCGPTVYDFAHIGNARPLIVFDVLFRLLRHLYGADHVTYVRNITDVDDKINARAAEEYPDLPLNEAIRLVTERTTRQFHEDVAALGCLKPTVEPRATEHIAEMKAMIETLVEKGFAYVSHDHVLFHVAAMPDYGRLSNRSLDEMIAGARVEVAPYKRDPMDFVLWKPSKPGEPAWDSPAGIAAPGRPGWHLECSAMSDRWLWQEALPRLTERGRAHPHEFDIHGGGIDLVFPHHENEIAQSRCAHGTDVMARYWLHNGFLQVEGEKMSKSLGNFITIRDLLKDWPGEVVRMNMLRTHYRQPMDWTVAGLREAERTLANWYELAGDIEPGLLCADAVDALSDDLNTPEAFAALHELRGEAAKGARGAKASLKASAELMGLLQMTAAEWTEARRAPAAAEQAVIVDFIAARAAARKAKNFAEADRIRAELEAMGIALKDTRDPATGELVTTWEVKR